MPNLVSQRNSDRSLAFFISTKVNLPYLVHINCLDCISTSENYGMILVLRLSFSKFYRPWQFNGIYLLVETASRDNSFKSTVHRSTSLSPAGTSTRYWMLITCIICPWRNTMKQTKKWNNIPKHLDPMTK
jgi:hypothetical protein